MFKILITLILVSCTKTVGLKKPLALSTTTTPPKLQQVHFLDEKVCESLKKDITCLTKDDAIANLINYNEMRRAYNEVFGKLQMLEKYHN